MDQSTRNGAGEPGSQAVPGPARPPEPGGSARPPARASARAPVSQATYWRRRGVALTTVLAALTLLTWGVNVALGGGRASSQAADRSGSASGTTSRHQHGGAVRQAASHAGHPADGPAPASHGHGGPGPLAGETVDLGSQPRAKPHPTAGPSHPSTVPAPGSGPHACALGAMVLTIRSGRSRYGPGQAAGFVVDAVSTASQPCGFNLGAKFISVVVDSAGTPMWDSASCIHGSGSQLVTLRHGVPASLQVTWDRRTSLSGCAGQGSAIPAGRYTVAAFDAQLRSKPVTFDLSGRAPAAH